ncbi:MAG: hypothetical protein ABL891_02535 [Burkholderiales bacterium]
MREHTEALAPPRALWVPFILGRPFGAPNDAAFQTKVLRAALELLEHDMGPVIADFPQDAPQGQGALTPAPQDLVCPVSFPRMKSTGTLSDNLFDEVSQLGAWHEVAIKLHGRTTLGVTGLPAMALANYLAAWLSDTPPARYRNDVTDGDALKQACDELRAFYCEAKSAQPGAHTSASIQRWFWLETAAGQAIARIKSIAANSAEPSVKAVAAMSLIPRAVEPLLKPA